MDIHPLSLTPNDPRYNSQWYLRKISAPDAWDIATGSGNIVVAILDTGVDYNHPDFAPNMWRNPGETRVDDQGRDKASNGLDDDQNGCVDDVHGVNVKDSPGDPWTSEPGVRLIPRHLPQPSTAPSSPDSSAPAATTALEWPA